MISIYLFQWLSVICHILQCLHLSCYNIPTMFVPCIYLNYATYDVCFSEPEPLTGNSKLYINLHVTKVALFLLSLSMQLLRKSCSNTNVHMATRIFTCWNAVLIDIIQSTYALKKSLHQANCNSNCETCYFLKMFCFSIC